MYMMICFFASIDY